MATRTSSRKANTSKAADARKSDSTVLPNANVGGNVATRTANNATGSRMPRAAQSPGKVDDHEPFAMTQKRAQVAGRLSKEAVKAQEKSAKDKLFADLLNHRVAPHCVGKGELAKLSGEQLHKVASSYGKGGVYAGHSTLSKDEMVAFLATGVKPQAKADSARGLRETAKDLKAQGLLAGPVSSARVADLRSAIATAKTGTVATVSKPTPRKGTADYNRDLLRNKDGKGYTAIATAKSKELFGTSISTLKAAQLSELVKALRLA